MTAYRKKIDNPVYADYFSVLLFREFHYLKTFFKKLMKNYKIVMIIFCLCCDSVFSQWQPSGSYSGAVLPFAVKGTLIIAGTYGEGAYISTDAGASWNYSSNGMTDKQIISLIVYGGNIFAGSETGGVYRSTDDGTNWTPVNNGLGSYAIHTLTANSTTVYAGTNLGVHMTTDNGNNWSQISSSSISNVIFALTVIENKLFAATVSGIFLTTNNGVNWTNVTNGVVSSVYCFKSYGNTIYAGSSQRGVYRSTDYGASWTRLYNGMQTGIAVRMIINENGRLYAATYGRGIYYSVNEGSNWLEANEGITNLTGYAVLSYGDYIFAGTGAGIFRRPATEFTAIEKTGEDIPCNFRLIGNYPNPFNPVTKIKFSLPEKSSAQLDVFDISGKHLLNLVKSDLSAGTYSVTFDGGPFASGVYLYRLTCDEYTETKKMILLK